MPIYEFYCPDCHRIYTFLSRTVNTTKRPSCPRCGRVNLERKVSLFAISKGRTEPQGEDDLPDVDETRMERAFAALAQEAESLDEDNPRQVARMMRKLYDSTGLPLTDGLEEAIRRMEAGEDPDKIEEEMGDVLEEEDPFGAGASGGGGRLRKLRKRLQPPAREETLYEL